MRSFIAASTIVNVLVRALLDVDDARHQDPGVADDHAARARASILRPRSPSAALDDGRVLVGMRRHVVAATVGHAKAAADVEMFDFDALARADRAPAHASAGMRRGTAPDR